MTQKQKDYFTYAAIFVLFVYCLGSDAEFLPLFYVFFVLIMPSWYAIKKMLERGNDIY